MNGRGPGRAGHRIFQAETGVGIHTQGAFDNFVNRGLEFGGQATLTAQAAGQGGGYAGAIPVSPGVWIYQLTGDGLAASITVKGSKYYKADDLN
jgi:lipid-binding SYLF domain-containing protein